MIGYFKFNLYIVTSQYSIVKYGYKNIIQTVWTFNYKIGIIVNVAYASTWYYLFRLFFFLYHWKNENVLKIIFSIEIQSSLEN